MLSKLIPYFQKYKTAAILCPVLMLIEVVGDVLMPLLMARIIDIGIPGRDVAFVLKTGLLMVCLALVALFCGAYSSRLAALAAQGAGARLRADLFRRIQDFSFPALDRIGAPSLITRLTSDVNNLQQSAMMGLRMLVRAPFMMILALFMALVINARLALIFIVAIPVLAGSMAFIMIRAHPRFSRLQQKLDGLNASVQENLIGIRVVKAFVRADHEKQRFASVNDDLTRTAKHAVQLVIFGMPVMQLVMHGCIISILWFGGHMVTYGQMETGELISFISYVTQILISLMMLSMMFLMFTRAKASGDRVVELLEIRPDLTDPPDPLVSVPDGSIEFKNVHFRYAEGTGKDTLSDISLSIKEGETIGIIGPTGSAKTTLCHLIPRLYDVTSGQVLVGGADVRRYAAAALRDAAVLVLQNNTLFSGTVRDNMRWGRADATDEQIQEALELSEAWPFVRDMPGGLDSVLEQGGVNLSGGQKQRLCIARALLKRPKIIMFDDSTSAVDMATDARMRASFKARLQGITMLVVAQRVRSIEHADRIVVMADGRIDAVGTHDELLASNEIYRDICLSQQQGVMIG